MKRFMLFMGARHYPYGGILDFIDSFDSFDELNNHLALKVSNFEKDFRFAGTFNHSGWANYYDTETKETRTIEGDEWEGFNWRDPNEKYYNLTLQEIAELKNP